MAALPKAAGLSHHYQEHNQISEDLVIIGGTQMFGMDAEAFRKMESKRNPVLERQIAEWVSSVTLDAIDLSDPIESLRSGIILCKLINAIRPNTIPKFNLKSIPLLEMENIGLYLKGCWTIGVPSSELFVTSDLYRRKGEFQVFQNLESVARIACDVRTFKGPKPTFAVRASFLKEGGTGAGGGEGGGKGGKDVGAMEEARKKRYEEEMERVREKERRHEEEVRMAKEYEEKKLMEKLKVKADERVSQDLQKALSRILELEKELSSYRSGSGGNNQSSSSGNNSKLEKEIGEGKKQLEGKIKELGEAKKQLEESRKVVDENKKLLEEYKKQINSLSSGNKSTSVDLEKIRKLETDVKEKEKKISNLETEVTSLKKTNYRYK